MHGELVSVVRTTLFFLLGFVLGVWASISLWPAAFVSTVVLCGGLYLTGYAWRHRNGDHE